MQLYGGRTTMYNIKDYLDNGTISRSKIAIDVKYRKLTKQDLNTLINDEDVKSVFIGSKFIPEVNQKQWTKEYLDELSYMAIGESFNEEYLFHLCEVAEHVNQMKEKNKLIVIAVIVATLGVIGTVVYSWINTKIGS